VARTVGSYELLSLMEVTDSVWRLMAPPIVTKRSCRVVGIDRYTDDGHKSKGWCDAEIR
jgi:hypothetical protein